MKILSVEKIAKESKRLAALYPVVMSESWMKRYDALNKSHSKLGDKLHSLRMAKCDFELGKGPCSCKEHADIQAAALKCQASANKINAMWHERASKEKEVYLYYFGLLSGARSAKQKYMKSRP